MIVNIHLRTELQTENRIIYRCPKFTFSKFIG